MTKKTSNLLIIGAFILLLMLILWQLRGKKKKWRSPTETIIAQTDPQKSGRTGIIKTATTIYFIENGKYYQQYPSGPNYELRTDEITEMQYNQIANRI